MTEGEGSCRPVRGGVRWDQRSWQNETGLRAFDHGRTMVIALKTHAILG